MPLTAEVTVSGRVSPVLNGLLERVGHGDRHAFDQLYHLTAPRVLGLVRAVLRDPSQSEEVSQEVFLQIWQTAGRFDASRGSALTWVFTMAHRRAVDRVRASQSSRERDLRVGIRDQPDPRDSVSEQIEGVFESERVRAAMNSLTPLQRQAIELSYFGGYTNAEVADITGVAVGTAKTRMRDGLIRLRVALAA